MSKQIVSFRADEEYLKKIEQLGSKLGLDFSKTVRLSVDKMLEKYLGTKEEILLVDNEKWNASLGVYLESFIEQVRWIKDLTETLTKKVKKTGNVQEADSIEISEADLSRWVDQAVKNDATFETKDVNPQVEKVKTAILTTVKKLKGRVG
jgi:antitoxin component of RelBE/YafQ-DinJ toxin-antitoxin module